MIAELETVDDNQCAATVARLRRAQASLVTVCNDLERLPSPPAAAIKLLREALSKVERAIQIQSEPWRWEN